MKNLGDPPQSCSVATYLCILIVRAYQMTLSLEHGIAGYVLGYRVCRFFPTCSAYAIAALRQYGLFAGLMVSLRRILRCHPWHAGGYDPL
ncbi:MAG: membrane protein insertion efficiency factor YidD [Candidatus Sungbacteria bacterium]|nr:membrane protein insertion efficiency factor YidD [Candidatus Sungbacteria bacterium]